MKPTSRARRRYAWLVRVLATAALLVLLHRIIDGDALLGRLSSLSLPWVLVGLALSLPMYALMAWRWRVIATRMDLSLDGQHALTDYYLSTLLNQTLPVGVAGDAVRAVRHARRLERDGMAPGSALGPAVRALLLERFSGILALLLAVLVSAISLWPTQPAIAQVALISLGGAGLVFALFVAFARRRSADSALGRFVRDGRAALVAGRSPWLHLLLSLGALALLIAMFYAAGRAAHVPVHWRTVVQLAPLVLVSMMLPLSFAGWGAREAVTAALFAAMALDITDGVALSVTFGLLGLLSALPGLLVLLTPSRATTEEPAARPGGDRPIERLPARAALLPLWMGGASVAAAIVGDARYLAVAAVAMFAIWAAARARPFVAGPANWVSLVRVLLTAGMAPGFPLGGRPLVLALLSVCLVLDGIDGWLARRTGTASALGALYDMESDAFQVMMSCLVLYTHDIVGVWGLTAGLLRYGFQLVMVLVPSKGGAPRSNFARYLYGALMTSLIIGFVFPQIAPPVVAVGTALISYSFARELWWSLGLARSSTNH